MISFFFSHGLNVTHCASGLGFGQTHGPGPLSVVHFFQVHLFLFRCSETFNQVGATASEPGIGGKGTTRPHKHLGGRQGHGIRQPLPSGFGIYRSGNPPALAVFLEGFMEGFRNFHFSFFIDASFFIGD